MNSIDESFQNVPVESPSTVAIESSGSSSTKRHNTTSRHLHDHKNLSFHRAAPSRILLQNPTQRGPESWPASRESLTEPTSPKVSITSENQEHEPAKSSKSLQNRTVEPTDSRMPRIPRIAACIPVQPSNCPQRWDTASCQASFRFRDSSHPTRMPRIPKRIPGRISRRISVLRRVAGPRASQRHWHPAGHPAGHPWHLRDW